MVLMASGKVSRSPSVRTERETRMSGLVLELRPGEAMIINGALDRVRKRTRAPLIIIASPGRSSKTKPDMRVSRSVRTDGERETFPLAIRTIDGLLEQAQ